MAKQEIKNVIETTYDGFILVYRHNDEMIYAYEGWGLVPEEVKKWVENHGYIKENRFFH